ncbi:glycerate kinase [Staphylococcus pasteuri]|uniref:glycerate kinase n=1 Tax=Staphylococcus pasteuri TaxID=45972 RepID=UPI001C3F9704|nr:glycerate kinase [Staphylococcus pasteuri]
MKIVIAPDSFKESMSARQAAEAIHQGFSKVLPSSTVYDLIPMADGGEGTTEVLMEALKASTFEVDVKDPLLRDICARYAYAQHNQTAIIEMAAASGLDLLSTNEKNPMTTSSYGTGQLINHALEQGAKKIILGIGGSATNDGGVGMLQALGVKFSDSNHNSIAPGGIHLLDIDNIDISQLNPKLKDVEIKVACDVTNPLLGDNGATAIYGPQKGATAKMIPKLDTALSHYHDKIKLQLEKDVKDVPGAGAAGGMGTALLAFLDVDLTKGIDVVLEETRFTSRIENANLVVTGEGKIDNQTILGKTPIGVAQASKQINIPVIAIGGSLGENYEAVYDYGIDSAFSIMNQPSDLKNALDNGYELLTKTAHNIARTLVLNLPLN